MSEPDPQTGEDIAPEASGGPQPGPLDTNSPEYLQARSRRNVAIALGLMAFVVVVFAVTMLKYVHNLQVMNGR